MKKRNCERFSIPGTTLYYKDKPGLLIRRQYPDNYYPVINMSRGGAKFLCNERLKAGKKIIVKIDVPGMDEKPEILANVRWISKNPEQSYRYQTGIAFNPYGVKKDENSAGILVFLKSVEQRQNQDV